MQATMMEKKRKPQPNDMPLDGMVITVSKRNGRWSGVIEGDGTRVEFDAHGPTTLVSILMKKWFENRWKTLQERQKMLDEK